MVVSEVVTLCFYVISMAFLPAYFGLYHLLMVVWLLIQTLQTYLLLYLGRLCGKLL